MRHRIAVSVVGLVVVGCGGSEPQPVEPATSAAPAESVEAPASSAASSASVALPTPPPAPLGTEEWIKKHVATFTAAWNAHDAKKIVSLYAGDAVFLMPGAGGMEEQRQGPGLETRLASYFTGFPDTKIAYTRVLAKRNQAVLEWIITGTNTGEFQGQKPTNKEMGYRGATVIGFDDQGVHSEHMYFDMVTVMMQLGGGSKDQPSRPVEKAPSQPTEFVVVSDDGGKAYEPLKAFYVASDKHDEKALSALVTDDFVMSANYAPGDAKKADFMKGVKEGATAFPDAHTDVRACWGFGDWAACESEWSATWKAPAMGMKPTKKKGNVHGLQIVKVSGGKLALATTYGNGIEFASSFGMPKPGDEPKGAKPAESKAPKDGGAKPMPKAPTPNPGPPKPAPKK